MRTRLRVLRRHPLASSVGPAREPSNAEQALCDTALGPIAYTDEGSGVPVVAIHGLPGSVRDFRWLAPPLGKRARVIRMDLPGFGRTHADVQANPSPHAWVAAVDALVRALELDRPVLIGHSMGGVVAAATAAQGGDAYRGLALVSSVGLRPHRIFRRVPRRGVSRILRTPFAGRMLRPLMRRLFVQGGFRGHDDAALARTMHAVASVDLKRHAEAVGRLSLPTLVAWSSDDPLIQADIAEELAEACPAGPRRTFSTGGHNPQKHHAEALAEAIGELLS